MNDHNLKPFHEMSYEEHKKLSSKGGTNRTKAIWKKKEEEAQIKKLKPILLSILNSEVKIQSLKDLLRINGIKENSLFSALSLSVLIKGIKKGDLNTLVKIMEILGETHEKEQTQSDENKSFNNLVEAIKSVRETKSKTK